MKKRVAIFGIAGFVAVAALCLAGCPGPIPAGGGGGGITPASDNLVQGSVSFSSGVFEVGQTVTVTASLSAPSSSASALSAAAASNTYKFYWFRQGLDGIWRAIPGTEQTGSSATSSYTLTEADKFSKIRVRAILAGANGYKDCDSTGLVAPEGFVYIPAGSFTMGSTGEAGRGGDEDSHKVTLTKGFFMSKYEVTQAEFDAMMGAANNPSTTKGDKYPVTDVNWYHAIAYCNKKSLSESLDPLYSVSVVPDWDSLTYGDIPEEKEEEEEEEEDGRTAWDAATHLKEKTGYRLASEAEWEYACRAGTTTAWYTGDAENAALQAAAWYSANAGSTVHEVGTKTTANAWGLYDMHGNVAEWTYDGYVEHLSADTDPEKGGAVEPAVYRGGSYSDEAAALRSAARASGDGWYSAGNLGFRVVYQYQTVEGGDDYAIGDLGPAGGWIFYDNGDNERKDGWRFLEAEARDLPKTYAWGGGDIECPTADDIGTGLDNTAYLAPHYHPERTLYKEHDAAIACNVWTSRNEPGGYSDWFLPSKEELALLWAARDKIGDFPYGERYWSSSQYSASNAFHLNVSSGDLSDGGKDSEMSVRPIRRF